MVYIGNKEQCQNLIHTVSIDISESILETDSPYKILIPQDPKLKLLQKSINIKLDQNKIYEYCKIYYETILSKLNYAMYLEMASTVYVTDDKPKSFSYKYVFAAWLDINSIADVYEIKAKENGKKQILRLPGFYTYIMEALDEIIKETIDLEGYNCIAAYNQYKLAENYTPDPSIERIIGDLKEHALAMAELLEKEYNEQKNKTK